jgi:hypothetical protein
MIIFKRFEKIYSSQYEKIKAGPDANEICKVMSISSSEKLLDPLYAQKIEKQIIAFYQYKLQAFREIEDYILSMTWLNNVTVKTMDRVRYFITHNCSYKDTCTKFGDELSAIQVSMYRSGAILEKKIGVDTINYLYAAKTKEEVDLVMDTFNTNINYARTSKLVVKEVAKLLPEAKISADFEPQDCLQEMRFLKSYTVEHVKESVKSLNKEKIAFLLYILESDDSYYKNEKEIYSKFLQRKITFDELKGKILEIENGKTYKKK